VFLWLAAQGDVPLLEMFNTFNMGIGMAVVLDPASQQAALDYFAAAGLFPVVIGEVIAGKRELVWS